MSKNLLLLIFVISTTNVFSQWNNNTAINNLVSNRNGDELEPFSISDGANGSIIFFADYGQPQRNFYAQKITTAGNIAWGNTANPVAICETNFDKDDLIAIPDGSGGAFISWSDYRDDGVNGEIYVQRINSAGVAQWGANGKRITISATQDDFSPALCSDGAGGIIIAWYWDNGTSNLQSFAQRLNGTGDIQWAANGVQVCTAPGFRGENIVVSDGGNGAFVFFIDTRNDLHGQDYTFLTNNDLTNGDIYGQHLAANGARLWTDNGIGIITATGNQYSDNVTGGIADGAGGAIIAFQNERSHGSTDIADEDVFAQRINANGASVWTANGVGVYTTDGTQFLEKIVTDGAGGAVFSISSQNDLLAQRINAAGITMWMLNGNQIPPIEFGVYASSMINDGNGNTILTYTINNGNLLKAQKINSSGVLLWGTHGIIVSDAPSASSFSPDIVSADNGSTIIGWSVYKNNSTSGSDIYAAKILANGTLTGTSPNLYITAANGNWNNPATWANGIIPPAGSAISIRHIITGNINASCTSLTIEKPAGNLTVLTGVTITVTN